MYTAAISNLAWLPSEEEQALGLMKKYAVGGLEIAPKNIWENPDSVSQKDAIAWRNELLAKQIRPVAMQAFLFGRKDCSLFGKEAFRQRLFEYIKRSMLLARHLGIEVMVFGAPSYKLRNGCSIDTADGIAIEFFRSVGDEAQRLRIHFCIEPTPAIYGSDYLLNTAEAVSLIARINHPNINLNLDFGTLKHEGKFDPESISQYLSLARHIHVSEPFLKPIDINEQTHRRVAQVLLESGYTHAVSIEMLHVKTMDELGRIINWFSQIYEPKNEATKE